MDALLKPEPDARAAVAQADESFAMLRAQLAMAGFSVQIVGDGAGGTAYMVSRWAMHHTLPDQVALAAFVRQVGGAA